MTTLGDLPDDAIVGGLVRTRKQELGARVEFLHYLAEMHRRRTFLGLGFPSLFAYCTDALGLSKGSTFRRTTAAGLLARFPVASRYLTDGRLNLTSLVHLRGVLDEKNVVEILDRAAGCTEDQVKELVANLRPQPAPPDLIRRLPTRENHSSGSAPKPAVTSADGATAVPPATASASATAGLAATATVPPPAAAAAPQTAPSQPPQTHPARVEPIAPDRYVLRMTVTGAFVADLESVRHALSHKMPGATLEQLLHACIRATLTSIDRRRIGVGKRPATKDPAPFDASIEAAVRHEVWERDDGRCAFVAPSGRRCGSRHQVEFHHLDPSAKGGASTADRISLRCRPHNIYEAEQDYGRAHIERKIALARVRDRRPPRRSSEPRRKPAKPPKKGSR